MNSEREKRVLQAAEIENEILNYQSAQETNAKTLAALRLAKDVLQEPPRKLRNCNLELQPRARAQEMGMNIHDELAGIGLGELLRHVHGQLD